MILDMGAPIRIDDVARELIEQCGQAVEIVYTGLRAGEKLDEILIAESEDDSRPVHDLITHVAVPPLGGYGVLGECLQLDVDLASAQLRSWCQADVTQSVDTTGCTLSPDLCKTEPWVSTWRTN